MPVPSFASDLTRADRRPPKHITILDEEAGVVPRHRTRCLELLEIFEIWSGQRREACGLPCFADFTQANLERCREKLSVIQVRDLDAEDLEFSIFGKHPADFLNGGMPLSMAKLRVDPLRREKYDDILMRVRRAIDTQSPSYVRKSLSWSGQGFIEYEQVLLPFAHDGTAQHVAMPTSCYVAATPMGAIAV